MRHDEKAIRGGMNGPTEFVDANREIRSLTKQGWAKDIMSRLRILVVEDEALIGMLLAEVLGQMGYEVCAIEDTEAGAIAAADRYRPDLMIVDARLSNGSGISAVEKIIANGFIPHVFVSGDAASIRAQKPGAVVLQKPFKAPDIAAAIQRALAAIVST